MANLPEVSQFDAGVYQLELTDPVQGGATGVDNKPLINLANRTRYLYDQLSALQGGVGGYAGLNSPQFTGSPTAPTPAIGDNSARLATTAFVAGTVFGVVFVDLTNAGSVVLLPAQYGVSTLVMAGALNQNVSVIFPSSSGKWTVRNQTSGAFTVTCKPAATAGVTVTQGSTRGVFTAASGAIVPAEDDYQEILPTINGKVNRSGDSMGPLAVASLTSSGEIIGNIGSLPNTAGASITGFDIGETDGGNNDRVLLQIVRSLATGDWQGVYAELRRNIDGSGGQGAVRLGDPSYDAAGVQLVRGSVVVATTDPSDFLRLPAALPVGANDSRAARTDWATAADAAVLSAAEGFAASEANAAQAAATAAAEAYALGQANSARSDAEAHADTGDAATLASAKAYADAGDAATRAALSPKVAQFSSFTVPAGSPSFDVTWAPGTYDRVIMSGRVDASNGAVIIAAYRDGSGAWQSLSNSSSLGFGSGIATAVLLQGCNTNVAAGAPPNGGIAISNLPGGVSGLRLTPYTAGGTLSSVGGPTVLYGV